MIKSRACSSVLLDLKYETMLIILDPLKHACCMRDFLNGFGKRDPFYNFINFVYIFLFNQGKKYEQNFITYKITDIVLIFSVFSS